MKSEARQAVQNKTNEQINHIQNTPDATNEEKQEAINRVSAELARVQAQINAEHTTRCQNYQRRRDNFFISN